uniref:Uncharacterized protein n=1 Tax=Molossus molossus TaxID=27622 RepID=A0A7J8IZK9_MOLMO|nr:hypothetical protein HJG59_010428 [Molossus molossus]
MALEGRRYLLHGKMTLLNTKPIAWAYSITLGIEMLNSFFSFYYVKFFSHLYKISEVAFYQAQIMLMIRNALNGLTACFPNNSKADRCSVVTAVLCMVLLCIQ